MLASKNPIKLLALVLGLVTIACQESYEYNQNIHLNSKWPKEQVQEFEFNIQDTTGTYSMQVNFINNNNYPRANVYLLSEFSNPNGQTIVDTLEYQLAFLDGDWMANHSGDSYSRQLVFKDSIKLNKIGKYVVKLKHGMRFDTLVGVKSIGLNIQKHKNGKTTTK